MPDETDQIVSDMFPDEAVNEPEQPTAEATEQEATQDVEAEPTEKASEAETPDEKEQSEDTAKRVPLPEVIKLRRRAQEAEAKLKSLEAKLSPEESTPKVFAESKRLEELEALAKDEDASLTGAEAIEMSDLRMKKAEHDRAENDRISKAQAKKVESEERKTLIDMSVQELVSTDPAAKRVIHGKDADGTPYADNLSNRDWEKVWQAGADAGQVMYDLIVKRTPELDESRQQGSETTPKQSKGSDNAVQTESKMPQPIDYDDPEKAAAGISSWILGDD